MPMLPSAALLVKLSAEPSGVKEAREHGVRGLDQPPGLASTVDRCAVQGERSSQIGGEDDLFSVGRPRRVHVVALVRQSMRVPRSSRAPRCPPGAGAALARQPGNRQLECNPEAVGGDRGRFVRSGIAKPLDHASFAIDPTPVSTGRIKRARRPAFLPGETQKLPNPAERGAW